MVGHQRNPGHIGHHSVHILHSGSEKSLPLVALIHPNHVVGVGLETDDQILHTDAQVPAPYFVILLDIFRIVRKGEAQIHGIVHPGADAAGTGVKTKYDIVAVIVKIHKKTIILSYFD